MISGESGSISPVSKSSRLRRRMMCSAALTSERACRSLGTPETPCSQTKPGHFLVTLTHRQSRRRKEAWSSALASGLAKPWPRSRAKRSPSLRVLGGQGRWSVHTATHRRQLTHDSAQTVVARCSPRLGNETYPGWTCANRRSGWMLHVPEKTATLCTGASRWEREEKWQEWQCGGLPRRSRSRPPWLASARRERWPRITAV